MKSHRVLQTLSSKKSKGLALKFVILIGFVSLFADMTYEGARSVSGPYLAELGANALVVGTVAGFGELLGYSLRLVSGYLIDKTARYWTIAITGYLVNLLAVPVLALTSHWQAAAFLMILERVGKAIRTPARDAMLAHRGKELGSGWVFGIHEALDKTGAMLGPLVIAVILYFKGGYREGFAVLLFPALIALSILFVARKLYPNPQNIETSTVNLNAEGMNKTFWLYVLSISFVAAGYADFSLMAYHFAKKAVLSDSLIPISYALAMGLSGVAAMPFGRLYDRLGFSVLMIVTAVSSFFAPLVFWGGPVLIFLGIAIWSIGLGAHESLMRAVVANMVPGNKLGSAYGVFNMSFGVFWFLGSVLMGMLYDISIPMLIAFSVATQLCAIVILFFVMKSIKK